MDYELKCQLNDRYNTFPKDASSNNTSPERTTILTPSIWDESEILHPVVSNTRMLTTYGSGELPELLDLSTLLPPMQQPVVTKVVTQPLSSPVSGQDIPNSLHLKPHTLVRHNNAPHSHNVDPRRHHQYNTIPTDNPQSVTIKVPGENFDPSSRAFTSEELQPQPFMQKNRKKVPETSKDEKYWAMRKRNNLESRRSREAKRLKENQILIRANYLEHENDRLRSELESMRMKAERLEQELQNVKSRRGNMHAS